MEELFGPREIEFIIKIFVALVCGVMIGLERELKQKPAGISTQSLVIIGATMFAFMSQMFGQGDPARIAAQIVSGVGFLGAGIILKNESKNKVSNLTTAASIWYAAAIGMAIGFDLYVVGIIAAIVAVLINRIPHVRTYIDD